MFKIAILQKRAINAQIDKNIESIIMAMKDVAFRTKREKFSYKIEKVRFCKNV